MITNLDPVEVTKLILAFSAQLVNKASKNITTTTTTNNNIIIPEDVQLLLQREEESCLSQTL